MHSFEFPSAVPSLFKRFQGEMDKAISNNVIEPKSLRIAQIVHGKDVVTRFSCDGHREVAEDGTVHNGMYLMFAVRSRDAFNRLVGVCGDATRKLQKVNPMLYLDLRISTALSGSQFYPCIVLDLNYVGYDERAIPDELAEAAWFAVSDSFAGVFGEPTCERAS